MKINQLILCGISLALLCPAHLPRISAQEKKHPTALEIQEEINILKQQIAARLFFHPFRNNEKLPIQENIGIGIAFSHGEKSGSAGLPTFRSDGQQSFLRFQFLY